VVPDPFLSAVVLAAGRSTRMGRDKALIEIDGTPLWQRQRDVLTNAGATEIFLSVRPEQTWTRNAKGFTAVIHDSMPGCGPMVGITAAIERSSRPLVAVLAVDLLAMTPAWFRSLRSECTADRGAVGRSGDVFEPLAAIYPRTLLWRFWEALTRAEYSLQAVINAAVEKDLMTVREIRRNESDWFANFNEPRPEK
jgi:molybdenum cofactor guanylyltransferase